MFLTPVIVWLGEGAIRDLDCGGRFPVEGLEMWQKGLVEWGGEER